MNVKYTRPFAAVAGVALLASLTACGGSSGAPAEGESGGEITAGVLPVTDAGPIVLGDQAGIFEEHDLDLTLETAQASPNLISAVIAGDMQIGYGGVTTVFQAVENGIDLVMIAAASATSDDPEAGINDILVLPDSGFKTAADLEGKKVAVNALNGYAQMLAQVSIADAGGDPNNVEWVELPIPDQPAALENGNIDAFVAGEPFGTLGRSQGFETLSNPHAALGDEPIVGGAWYASRAAVEANPDLYENIAAALNESNTYALENEKDLRAAIAEFTGIEQDLADEIRLSYYGTEDLTTENVQPMADAALEFGLVKEPVDLDAIIWAP